MRSVRVETAMHDRRNYAPETFMFGAYGCGSKEATLMLARALVAAFPTSSEGTLLRAVRSVETTPRLTTLRLAYPYTTQLLQCTSVTTLTKSPTKPNHKNGHPLLLLRRSLSRYKHTDLPPSIHAQPANHPRLPVSVLLINAIAVLSEDRFLARSTSPPTQPKVTSPRNPRPS